MEKKKLCDVCMFSFDEVDLFEGLDESKIYVCKQCQREFIPDLTRAAMGAGANALFIEVHDNPQSALCDATTQLPLKFLEALLIQAKTIYDLVRQFPELKIN